MSPHMIDEVNASQKSFIHETPQYVQWGFLGQQDKRFMNRKSDGGHPFSQQPSQTYYEDPLIVGSKEYHNGNFFQYNNRAVESSTKHMNGGALMYQQPVLGDSDSDYSSDEMESSSDEEEGGAFAYTKSPTKTEVRSPTSTSTDAYTQGNVTVTGGPHGDTTVNMGKRPRQMKKRADAKSNVIRSKGSSKKAEHLMKMTGGDLTQMTREELMNMIQCGGGIYDGFIKPAGKVLSNIGKEVVNHVVIPVGKELAKDAIRGAIVGAGKRGRPKGSKNKKKDEDDGFEEIVFQHPPKPSESDPNYLKQIDVAHRGEMAHLRDEIAKLVSEKGRVEGEKKFEEGMIKEAPTKKARKPRKKVEKNIDDELHRVEGETKKERAKMAVEKLLHGDAPKARVKRGVTDKTLERADIVKQVMKDQGLKLGAASKYVKDHNLYKKATGEYV